MLGADRDDSATLKLVSRTLRWWSSLLCIAILRDVAQLVLDIPSGAAGEVKSTLVGKDLHHTLSDTTPATSEGRTT